MQVLRLEIFSGLSFLETGGQIERRGISSGLWSTDLEAGDFLWPLVSGDWSEGREAGDFLWPLVSGVHVERISLASSL